MTPGATARAGLSRSTVLLPTCLVGSLPQPNWLVDRDALVALGVPRVRVPQIWRVPSSRLREAQDDATMLAICLQERLGLDIVTDGEIRRESYSNYFATSLSGVDPERTGMVLSSVTGPVPVPLFTAPVRRARSAERDDVTFLRAHTDRLIKATLPGPFTMSEQAETTYHSSREALALDLADAVNAEVRELFAAGADIVQIDEPWMERWPERSTRYGVKVLNRALEGVTGTVALHICFGYGSIVREKRSAYRFLAELEDTPVTQVSLEAAQPNLDLTQLRMLPSKTIALGVLDLSDDRIETPEEVARRIERALEHVPADRLIVAPDCGLKYLHREVAVGKLRAMVAGAQLVRDTLGA